MIAEIPCDFSKQSYCNLPGSIYPWHAVRRFVHENQGLMKRMYGDVRHISILRSEIKNNDIDVDDIENAAARYSRDGHRRSSKLLHVSDISYGNLRNNEVMKEPHFRPLVSTITPVSTAATKPTTFNTTPIEAIPKLTTTVASTFRETNTTTSLPKDLNRTTVKPNNVQVTETEKKFTKNEITSSEGSKPIFDEQKIQQEKPLLKLEDAKLSDTKSADEKKQKEKATDNDNNEISLASNSVYEPVLSREEVLSQENIQIVESPNLGLRSSTMGPTNHLDPISTILRVATTEKSVNTIPSSATLQRRTESLQILEIISSFSRRNETIHKPPVHTKLVPNNKPLKNNTTPTPTNSSPREPTELFPNITATLLSGETLRKPVSLEAIATIASVKPVLRDGQLFQDTVQKDPILIGNGRGV